MVVSMYRRSVLVVLLVSIVLLPPLHGQSCIRTHQISGALPQLQDYRGVDLNFDVIRHQHQAIIPSYKFISYGNITEWGVDIDPSNSGDQFMYILDLQVWRPSPTVHTTGCYSLVGNNRFTSVTLSGGVAKVTPLPQNWIQFQPGDVLGFYVESSRRNNAASRGVVVLNDLEVRGDRRSQREEVWYANIAHYPPYSHECPYPIGYYYGVLHIFTNAAPVISISTLSTQIEVLLPEPTTTLIRASTTNNLQTSPSGTLVATLYTESLQPTSEQAQSANLASNSAGIIAGALLATLSVIITGVALLVVFIAAVICHRKPSKKQLGRDGSMVSNAVYGTTFENTGATSRRGDTYDYPRHGIRLLESLRGESSCPNSTDMTEERATGNIYTMNISSQRNEAYGASDSFSSARDETSDFEYSYVQYT